MKRTQPPPRTDPAAPAPRVVVPVDEFERWRRRREWVNNPPRCLDWQQQWERELFGNPDEDN